MAEYRECMRPATRHNHIGFMVYEAAICWCTECGQQWKRSKYGWETDGRR